MNEKKIILKYMQNFITMNRVKTYHHELEETKYLSSSMEQQK